MWTDAQGKDNRRWRNVAKHAQKVVDACRCVDSFVYKYLITQKQCAYTLRTGCSNSSSNNMCAWTVHKCQVCARHARFTPISDHDTPSSDSGPFEFYVIPRQKHPSRTHKASFSVYKLLLTLSIYQQRCKAIEKSWSNLTSLRMMTRSKFHSEDP
jgi:hypothetical protein